MSGGGRGSVYTPNHFSDLGPCTAIDKALSRLAKSGDIRRISRGVYDYPIIDPLLGELSPTIEAITKALTHRDRVRLQPSGAYALNLLGLSEQVPAKIVFLTDGKSRKLTIGRMTIELRQTTPRNMATAGRLSGLVIQAFRALGKDHVTKERIAKLRTNLPVKDRKALLKDSHWRNDDGTGTTGETVSDVCFIRRAEALDALRGSAAPQVAALDRVFRSARSLA